MTRKKSGFWTFVWSLLPGAGEMYMGFMKQGLSIMAVFWGTIFVASYLNIGPVLFILPILWCYSFFNVNNLRSLPDEEFYALEDEYLFCMDSVFTFGKWGKKQTDILAAVLIIAGGAVLWNHFADYMEVFLPYWLYRNFIRDVPQTVIAILLIVCGIYLIRGKKASLEKEKPQGSGGKETAYDMPVRYEAAYGDAQKAEEECSVLTGEVIGKGGEEK